MSLISRALGRLSLSIGQKMAVGFSLLIALSVTTGLIGGLALERYGESARTVALTSKLQAGFLAARTEEKNFLLHQNPEAIARAQGELDSIHSVSEELLTTLPKAGQALVAEIQSEARKYSGLLQDVVVTLEDLGQSRDALALEEQILAAHLSNESRLQLAPAMFAQMQRDERDFLVTGAPETLQAFMDRLKRTTASIEASSLSLFEQRQVTELFQGYGAALQNAADLMATSRTLEGRMEASANSGVAATSQLQTDQVSRMTGDRQLATLAIAIATLVSILLGALLAWFLTRLIVRPIRDAVKAAQKVAEGDLRDELTSSRKDESGLLLNALGRMIDNLRDLIHQIDGNAREIA
ncbi:hypothetical protein C7H09_09740 [Marinobacter fuscus]|uniref:HAMP domain-containing protein n=1 Tax=Marinobacter fuscus TaxID=2109942 RepID=A0A2T1KAC9_9GAMM|nr:methyl-accepting chemotaxis protein [Marinobacter fuscus]PSF07075.1 hypothetical protein C7H09_09740 [Marinobacter fuscus]